MSWKVRAQYCTGRGNLRWLEFGPMAYSRAVAEGRRHANEGRNARLVDPDGCEGPLIQVVPAPRPRRTGVQLDLFSTE